jgi:hypothetical protein
MYCLEPCSISTKTKDRAARKPRLDAERIKYVVDLLVIEIDDQIARPIAGALLVALRRAGQLVVVAIGANEISGVQFVRA